MDERIDGQDHVVSDESRYVAAVILGGLVDSGFRIVHQPEYSAKFDGYWVEVSRNGVITSILVKPGN